MVELYKSALARQVGTNVNQEQNTDLGEENKLKNVKHQDIVRLYDIILQVRIPNGLEPFFVK